METSTIEYVSPDGALTFLVIRDATDVTMGFAGNPWHTHGDILVALSGFPLEEAVSRFVADLLENRLVIAVATVDGLVRDVWVNDDPEKPDRYKPENEMIQLRYWSGEPYARGDPNRHWNL